MRVGNEYDMATTMLITFIVNNHVNETDNARAEVWERAFVDYLKNYPSVYFNFSFSSEVIINYWYKLSVCLRPLSLSKCALAIHH